MKVSLGNKRKKVARISAPQSTSENGEDWIFGHFDDEDEEDADGSASHPIAMVESDD